MNHDQWHPMEPKANNYTVEFVSTDPVSYPAQVTVTMVANDISDAIMRARRILTNDANEVYQANRVVNLTTLTITQIED